MSNLTRKDIVQTVGQTLSAFALAIGVVAAGAAYFVALAQELEDSQEEVLSLEEAVMALQTDVATLEGNVAEILEWVRSQEGAGQDQGSASE